jgi:hypothetical protein
VLTNDLIAKLPPEAREIAIEIDDAAEMANLGARNMYTDRDREHFNGVIREREDQLVRTRDAAGRAKLALDIERAKAERKRKIDAQERARADWEPLCALRNAIDQWLRNPAGAVRPFEVAAEHRPQHKTVAAARDAIAAQIEALRLVIAAPRPMSEALEMVRAYVAALAARGSVDVFHALERAPVDRHDRSYGMIDEERPIKFPEHQIRLEVTTAPIQVHGTQVPGGVGIALGAIPDAIALVAWLDPAGFLARIEQELRERSDEANAIASDERAARMAAAYDEILGLQYDEESLVRLARGQGLNIARRPDACPAAVLGLAVRDPKAALGLSL